ncbi:hypothetical protein COB64_03385 [Candidatus Wolfebacteria bacterium]|nr:MAG: hypothetical protein COB64_03385 [Candidatus Wolfebacteria bacterium]
MRNYKNLEVWKKSMDLTVAIYSLTDIYPKEEIYGLTSQIRRAAVSIPSNIAEGKLRGTDSEFKRYLFISFASGGELETQLEISKRLPKTNELDYSRVDSLLEEVMKMLNSLISKLGASS